MNIVGNIDGHAHGYGRRVFVAKYTVTDTNTPTGLSQILIDISCKRDAEYERQSWIHLTFYQT